MLEAKSYLGRYENFYNGCVLGSNGCVVGALVTGQQLGI
jgi:hypothetical protein